MSDKNFTNPLWQFMLTTYAKAGVKELCLSAQNDYGLDVLLLLLDAWLRQEKHAWPEAPELQEYLHWREQMIVPVRTLRMSLNKQQEPLRSQLLTAELSAEKQGVALLYAVLAKSAAENTEGFANQDFLTKNFVFFCGDLKSQLKDVSSFYRLFVLLA